MTRCESPLWANVDPGVLPSANFSWHRDYSWSDCRVRDNCGIKKILLLHTFFTCLSSSWSSSDFCRGWEMLFVFRRIFTVDLPGVSPYKVIYRYVSNLIANPDAETATCDEGQRALDPASYRHLDYSAHFHFSCVQELLHVMQTIEYRSSWHHDLENCYPHDTHWCTHE